jgi:hypothetical protein
VQPVTFCSFGPRLGHLCQLSMVSAANRLVPKSRSPEGAENKACSKKYRTFAIKNLLLLLQHFKHCPLQSSPPVLAIHRSQRFFHCWNSSWNAFSVMAEAGPIHISPFVSAVACVDPSLLAPHLRLFQRRLRGETVRQLPGAPA